VSVNPAASRNISRPSCTPFSIWSSRYSMSSRAERSVVEGPFLLLQRSLAALGMTAALARRCHFIGHFS
jgi:hypothetical protein